MSFTAAEQSACEALVRLALDEDLAAAGDLTCAALLPATLQGQAAFVARSPGVVAGLPAAQLVFARLEPAVHFEARVADGTAVVPGTVLAVVGGPMTAILGGERTALNFLQRLSGVATNTAGYVAAVAGLPARILDTRKTTPGWRLLEKYAVRQGGGHNHRIGLYDGVLIKDNHLAALGTGADAVARAVQLARTRYGRSVPLEIEVDTLEQLEVALRHEPDIVLLDNMGPPLLREAVRLRNARVPDVLLEASGGITLENLRDVAATGIDRISIGALTHSARALDIALDYQS